MVIGGRGGGARARWTRGCSCSGEGRACATAGTWGCHPPSARTGRTGPVDTRGRVLVRERRVRPREPNFAHCLQDPVCVPTSEQCENTCSSTSEKQGTGCSVESAFVSIIFGHDEMLQRFFLCSRTGINVFSHRNTPCMCSRTITHSEHIRNIHTFRSV